MLYETNVVRKSKRGGHTMHTSIPMVANVLRWCFFEFDTHSEHYFTQLPSKREFFKVTYLTLRGLKKFSRGH